MYFYPRPPRGGRPGLIAASTMLPQISIHALREEGDPCLWSPTPWQADFYPRPPRGGRLSLELETDDLMKISIHALREEGDGFQRRYGAVVVLFLSTPSARRATSVPTADGMEQRNFYPRPPRGGRHKPSTDHKRQYAISIHALREEGDMQGLSMLTGIITFLSTPSARRATAKTERKHPAFVSLYTSLHKLQRDVCKPNRKITPLLAQTAGIPVRSVPENHVCCRFALAGHQKISTLSWANSGCSPTCSTLVW